MKKAGRILSLVTVLLMIFSMSAWMAFAAPATAAAPVTSAAQNDISTAPDTSAPDADSNVNAGKLKINDSYPKDGGKDAAIENLGVKIYFDGTFTDKKLGDSNDEKVQLYDPDGKKLPTILLYSETEEGVALVLLDTNAKDAEGKPYVAEGAKEYKLKIQGDFADDNNNTIGQDTTIAFTTINQNQNTMVYMIMTFAMFGGIAFFSIKSNNKKAEKEAPKKDEKVNPYKEAKKTGKSVEEIVEKDQKAKAKKAAKEAKRAQEEEDEYDDFEEEEYLAPGHYRVKTKRTVREGGSEYITGRKALAEKKAKEEAERKALEAKWAQQSKKKGKGKKK